MRERGKERKERRKEGRKKETKKETKRKEERGKWGTLSSTVSPEDAREGRAYILTCQRLPARVPPCLLLQTRVTPLDLVLIGRTITALWSEFTLLGQVTSDPGSFALGTNWFF